MPIYSKISQEIIRVYEKFSNTLSFSYKKELIKIIKDNRPFLRIKRKRKSNIRRRRNFFFRIKRHLIYNSGVFVKYPNWYFRWKILPVKYKIRKYRFRSLKKVALGNRPVKLFLKRFKWKLKKKYYKRSILHWKYRRSKKKLNFINNFNKTSLPLYYFINRLKIKRPKFSLKTISKDLEEAKKKFFFEPKTKGYRGKNFIPNFKYKKQFFVNNVKKIDKRNKWYSKHISR